MKFEIKINTDLVKNEIEKKQIEILDAIGQQAVSNAKINITDAKRIDTGILRNSIKHTVSGGTVFIGTPEEYGVWHEVGTGSHATDGNGRKGYWVYVPGEKYERKGDKKIYTLREAIALAAQIRKKYK